MIKHNQNKVLQLFTSNIGIAIKKKKTQQGGGAGLTPPSYPRGLGRGQDLWEGEAGSAASWPVYERSLGSSKGLCCEHQAGLGWAAGPLAEWPKGPAAPPCRSLGGASGTAAEMGMALGSQWQAPGHVAREFKESTNGKRPCQVHGSGRPQRLLSPPSNPGKMAGVESGAADRQLGKSRGQVRRAEDRAGQLALSTVSAVCALGPR